MDRMLLEELIGDLDDAFQHTAETKAIIHRVKKVLELELWKGNLRRGAK